MGLKERNHLENTLSQIRKKSTKLKKIEQKLSNSKERRTLAKDELYSSEKALESANLGLERYEKEALDAIPLSEAEEKRLLEITEKLLPKSREKYSKLKEKMQIEEDWKEIKEWILPGILVILLGASMSWKVFILPFFLTAILMLFVALRNRGKPPKSKYDLEHKSLDTEIRSLNAEGKSLERKMSTHSQRINAPAEQKKRIKGLEKEVSKKKSALVSAEHSVSKNETEVQTLSNEIKDYYESIKHLIPFADKLESDQ